MEPCVKPCETRAYGCEKARGSSDYKAEVEVEEILGWFKRPFARVLDLGCGTGRHAVSLAGKGYHVVGLDRSSDALTRAAERSAGMTGLSFKKSDLEEDDLTSHGIQDLVLSLGNTMSHLSRTRLIEIFLSIRRILAPGGVFCFNTLYWSNPTPKSSVENDPSGEVSVIWERKLNEEKGTMLLKGHFVKDGVTQVTEAQCYKAPEVVNLLKLAGFGSVRWSNRLDFKGRNLAGVDTMYYRVMLPSAGHPKQFC